jgi:hypothetical protein
VHTKLKIIQERVAQGNKGTPETEKSRDESHNQKDQIEQRLYPKRAHTHDDAGDAHEMITEVDNWDLRVHRLGSIAKSKVTLDIMHGKERTSTGKITSRLL